MPCIAPDDLVTAFEDRFGKLGGVPYRAANRTELQHILRTIFASGGVSGVVLSGNPLLGQVGLPSLLRGLVASATGWPSDGEADAGATQTYRQACFAATVGITGVDLVLAETGTLVVSSQTEGSQLSSLTPAIHIALYRRGQLRASLEEVLEQVPSAPKEAQPAPGRSVVFITGTSRTADIEQILVRGVHGPREVYAILIGDDCLRGQF